jgi:DNA invertase Pin-like site-specific DNA recombinase
MNLLSTKIQPEHLQRLAYVYVRQSSLAQLQDHQESTRRQYELQQRAWQLGWSRERIVVLDADLGHSASDPQAPRTGFAQLLAEVALGRVGAIFSVEVSRLARIDSEWHRLVELAALTGALLIDERQEYNPRSTDDRLLLGFKGLLSSLEVRQMGQRLWENKLRKAQRGELHIHLPIGLVFVRQLGVQLDPNEQVRSAVALLFERFRLSGSITQVVRYFTENGLLFPRRQGWEGPLEWTRLSSQRTWAVLNNPAYAGAYAYGRVTHRAAAKPLEQMHQRKVRLPPQQWLAEIWQAFSGYITQAQFEANQAQMASHRKHLRQKGRRQDGMALLSGILICGRCGRRMTVVYSGKEHQHISYVCNHQQRRYGEPTCQSIPGREVDQAVTTAVLAALTPAQIELSLAVLEEIDRQQAFLKQQWTLRLEAAGYAVRLAKRRYEQVDPDNRLVARTLEQAWEAHLQEQQQLDIDYHSFLKHSPLQLDETHRQQLRNLVEDLPKVWQAENTSWAERKELLRLLIADVTLTRQEPLVLVQIRWHTNLVDAFHVTLPIRGAAPIPAPLIARVRSLCPAHSDRQIAEILNQEGLSTAQGKPFTPTRVLGVRRRSGIQHPCLHDKNDMCL